MWDFLGYTKSRAPLFERSDGASAKVVRSSSATWDYLYVFNAQGGYTCKLYLHPEHRYLCVILEILKKLSSDTDLQPPSRPAARSSRPCDRALCTAANCKPRTDTSDTACYRRPA